MCIVWMKGKTDGIIQYKDGAKRMILYFSGTGNSEYAAKKIGIEIEDEVCDILDRIRAGDHSEICSERPFVFAYPTYAWQMPKFMQEWMRKTVFSGNRKAYFVTTCGDSKGDTEQNLRKLCREKNLEYMGCSGIVMPENYIAMFHAPVREEAIEIIRRADPVLSKAAAAIAAGVPFAKEPVSVTEKICSSIVNKAFYPLCVKDRKFYTLESCTGCGACTKLCPMNNIEMAEGRPKWKGHCTHCMACICKCPQEAIEYGSKSKGQPRYTCPIEAE